LHQETEQDYLESTGGPMDRLVIRSKEHQQELSGIGARESEMDIQDTIGQRIDDKGTKLEDLAGTGEGDSPGG
jgi:hypothetical protein